MIYLDWNATTPPDSSVHDAMSRALREAWANPSSTHGHGAKARREIEAARAAIAELSDVDPRDVVLTSGGTEANNLALGSFAQQHPGAWLLTSALEHPSVAKTAAQLEAAGRVRLRWLKVRAEGQIDVDDLAQALAECEGPKLVAVQAVNHETGVIQPLSQVFAAARQVLAHVHVDAVQAFGKLRLATLEADSRSLAGHKLRGPKGIGALILRPGGKLLAQQHGGSQERGLRAGTVDPVACAGLAVAARRAHQGGPARYEAQAALRDRLQSFLLQRVQGSLIAGLGAPRAPHVLNWVVPGQNGSELTAALSLEGLSVSAGAACSAGTVEPSPVLAAMFGPKLAASGVRFSLGEETTLDDVVGAERIVERVLARAALR